MKKELVRSTNGKINVPREQFTIIKYQQEMVLNVISTFLRKMLTQRLESNFLTIFIFGSFVRVSPGSVGSCELNFMVFAETREVRTVLGTIQSLYRF